MTKYGGGITESTTNGILNWKGEILEGGLELPILNKNIQNFDDRLITYDLLTHHSTQWRHQ